VAEVGVTLVVVEVEPWVLPAGAGAEVGGKPIAATNTGAAATNKAGRWARGGTTSITWEEHYWTELSQPSSSLLPCGCGSHCLRC
jgi:hypothetical protein